MLGLPAAHLSAGSRRGSEKQNNKAKMNRIKTSCENLRHRLETCDAFEAKWGEKIDNLGFLFPENLHFCIPTDCAGRNQRDTIKQAGDIFGRALWTHANNGKDWIKIVDGVRVTLSGAGTLSTTVENVSPMAFIAELVGA